MKLKNNAVKKIKSQGLSPLQACSLVVSLVLMIVLSAEPAGAVDASYDDLVNEARSGNTDPLLSWLKHNPQRLDGSMRADWLQVANWGGDDQ
ncbi:MAG: hypothetical protein H9917_11615 [Candidatus Oceanisphaera merdipullorum]|nr:hypothetical protein [Candidatus Oceanisphaera merdipullorum]